MRLGFGHWIKFPIAAVTGARRAPKITGEALPAARVEPATAWAILPKIDGKLVMDSIMQTSTLQYACLQRKNQAKPAPFVCFMRREVAFMTAVGVMR